MQAEFPSYTRNKKSIQKMNNRQGDNTQLTQVAQPKTNNFFYLEAYLNFHLKPFFRQFLFFL